MSLDIGGIEDPGYLFLLPWPATSTGGVNEVVLALAAELRSRGFSAVVGVATWTGEPQPAVVRGIPVYGIRLRAPFARGRLLPGFFKTFLRDALAFLRFVREHRIAAVNSHFPGFEAFVPVLLRKLGYLKSPVVLSFHGADLTAMRSMQGFERRAARFLIENADSVTACSEALRREVAAFAPACRSVTIHNGIDSSMFVAVPKARTSPVRLLSIGKFEHKKGHDVLLRALEQLQTPVHATIVGAEGPELDRTRQSAVRLGVEIHVNVPHERIPEFFQQADLFVLPSRSEPFGLVLLEAGASGVPVIASRTGGIPELIENERTGLLVEPDDAAVLAAAITRLCRDADLSVRLASAWRQTVLSRWSWSECASAYLRAARLAP